MNFLSLWGDNLDRGTAGNAHLTMQDKSNQQTAAMIPDWLRKEFGGAG